MCVIHGSGCGQISQWGHVIPQGQSAWLVYELSNSFRQSNSCNTIHARINAPYFDWYEETWGRLAFRMLKDEWKKYKGIDYSTAELRDMVISYFDLYDMRHSFSTSTKGEKIEAGYYGNIIKEAWIKEGRI